MYHFSSFSNSLINKVVPSYFKIIKIVCFIIYVILCLFNKEEFFGVKVSPKWGAIFFLERVYRPLECVVLALTCHKFINNLIYCVRGVQSSRL